jgi:hypothetical protein
MATADVLRPGPIGQPDIGYAPEYAKYLKRGKERQASGKLEKTLPAGFPTELRSDLVWDGNTIGQSFDWRYSLNASELEEIETALKHFKCTENHISINSELC